MKSIKKVISTMIFHVEMTFFKSFFESIHSLPSNYGHG